MVVLSYTHVHACTHNTFTHLCRSVKGNNTSHYPLLPPHVVWTTHLLLSGSSSPRLLALLTLTMKACNCLKHQELFTHHNNITS